MARAAICGGVCPSTTGSVSICASRPSTASCSIAAGRRTSSEAISTLRRCRSVRRLASLAVVVVLPEPCRPTIMMATGGAALRSMPWLSAPSVATSWSCTIFTTIWPGVTDFITSTPTACFFTPSVKARATSSATSASSSARRTSRKRSVDVGFAERAAAGEAVENAAQFFRQVVEHQSANTFAPEGALRCRAVASGLLRTGRRSWNSTSLARTAGTYWRAAKGQANRLAVGRLADPPIP